jgi:hypothetical protein
MPMICHRTAFESCGGPILHPEQKIKSYQFKQCVENDTLQKLCTNKNKTELKNAP